MSENRELYVVGFIVGVFGIRGEVKVKPITYSSKRFTKNLSVWIGRDENVNAQYTIDAVRFHQPHVVLKFREVSTREECEAFVRNYVFVEKSDRVHLPPRTWFISDIIGLMVFNETGEQVGKIIDVLPLPANHVYVVVHGNREILIPAIPEVVKEVDLENRTMTIHVLDGLLDV